MKKTILILLLSTMVLAVSAQGKRKDQVKRKYQKAEQVNENIPLVQVHGRVLNVNREPLAGASITVPGTRLGVNANADGEYFLTGLPTGKVSIQASFVGYQTKVIDYYLQEGPNDVYFTLDQDDITLEPVMVTSQKREQQALDVPVTMNVISSSLLENANIRELGQLSDFVPGLNIRVQTPHRPSFVVRGLTSDEVSPNAQPRVSVYYNNVPTSRGSMALAELYDMERVEVLKGPQGTLFGRGSQIGVIHFLSKRPDQNNGGYLTAGMGDYGMKEIQGAVNIPIAENKLFARAAGIYSYRDGYVENTFGGTLNGKNTIGGRFSLRYLPFYHTKVDLVVNYQKDDEPGVAFMSKKFPNAQGVTDIFKYQASLEQGKNLKNNRDVLGSSLEIKHFRNEHNYLSSITSYYTNSANSRWDGDGTAAPAIDMAETADVKQFTQELRYNFSKGSRTNGSVGASYWREKVDQTYWFSPNEQHMVYLFLQPDYLIAPDGKAYPMPALPAIPDLGPLGGMPLPTSHEEENLSGAVNQSYEAFLDATQRMTPRLSFTVGLRGTYERFNVSNESVFTGGSPSVLGMLIGNSPNLFFKPVDRTDIKDNFLSFTWRGNLKYDFTESANIFIGYAKGRRPNVLQFNSLGKSEVMNAEIVHSFDAGLKMALARRIWADLGAFYQLYSNFQTTAWIADPQTGEFNYLIQDAGKATSYGAEANLRAALLKNIELFGNYAYIHARFDSIDSRGNEQQYAGNSFRLTPEHSFTVGLNARVPLTQNLLFFAVPSYAWKSHIWFEDANTAGLEQNAYGMLNLHTGFELKKPNLTIALSATNLLDEKYLISAGNTGSMFGVPTFVPGAPRMLSAKLTWKF